MKLKIIGIVLLVLIFGLVAVVLPSCKPEDEIVNVALTDAISKTKEVENKSVNSTISLTLIAYDGEGNPMRVTMQLGFDRVRKDGVIYIRGNMGISEFILSPSINALVTLGLSRVENPDLRKFIRGEVKGEFELGYKDGTVNGRADICALGEEPDYKYAFSEEELSLFIGAGFADILAEQESASFDYIKEIDILNTVMEPIVPTVDFATMENTLGGDINIGTGLFNFQYSISGGSLLDIILAEINEVYGQYLLNLDAEDLAWVQNVYDSYYDMAKGWITIGDTIYTGSANSEGYLLSSGYETRVTIKIPDVDVVKIGTELDLAAESEITNLLKTLHNFVSSENGVANITEISFVLNIQETYGYTPEIDLNSEIFTPASVSLDGRTVFRREVEGDGFSWIPYGGDFA